MDAELIYDRERRAAKHSALADPARLQIVDLLTLGDVSPGDLRAILHMPSNLVAHHLRVLENQGIVARRRSEADRRRSYVHLLPDALVGLVPGSMGNAHRIIFVCTANSARSQLAAALWQRASAVPATSAGTHPADRVEPRAVEVAARNDLTLNEAVPRPLEEVLHGEDFIITVCDKAREELGDLGGLHWSVPDPVRVGSNRAFDAAYEDIARRIESLAPRLLAA